MRDDLVVYRVPEPARNARSAAATALPVPLPRRPPQRRGAVRRPGVGPDLRGDEDARPAYEPSGAVPLPAAAPPGRRVTLEKVGGRFAKARRAAGARHRRRRLARRHAPRDPHVHRRAGVAPPPRLAVRVALRRAFRARHAPARAAGRVDRLHQRRQGARRRRASSCPRRSGACSSRGIATGVPVDSAPRALPSFVSPSLSSSSCCCSSSPAAAPAKEPPNQNDPCSSAGRNTCGTTGVGFYETYKYGLRWFGDYRGAVPDARTRSASTCSTGTRRRSTASASRPPTRSRTATGKTVSLENRRRMAYAMWAYGRSGEANQQAAVMLYVHGADGRRAPRRGRPVGVSDAVAAIYDEVAPRRGALPRPVPRRGELPGAPAGRRAGHRDDPRALGVRRRAPERRASRCRRRARAFPLTSRPAPTASRSVAFTAKSADGATIEAKTEPIASTLPVVYAPTTPAAAAERAAARRADSQVVTGSGADGGLKAQAQRRVGRGARHARPSARRAATTSRSAGVGDGYQGRRHRAAVRPVPLDRRDPLRRRAGVGGHSGRRTARASTRRAAIEAAEARLVRLPAGRPGQRRLRSARRRTAPTRSSA